MIDMLNYAQARSQKFAMGGLFWGPGGEAPSRWKLGVTKVWERSPQGSKILHCFAKTT